jgi:hypothetical protein
MRPLTRRSLTAMTWSVLASTFTCSFSDDEEEEDDKKPGDRPAETRRGARRSSDARPSRAHPGALGGGAGRMASAEG